MLLMGLVPQGRGAAIVVAVVVAQAAPVAEVGVAVVVVAVVVAQAAPVAEVGVAVVVVAVVVVAGVVLAEVGVAVVVVAVVVVAVVVVAVVVAQAAPVAGSWWRGRRSLGCGGVRGLGVRAACSWWLPTQWAGS